MTSETPVGTIAGLYRYPVKSMGGETLSSAPLTSTGLLGDRAFGLIDVETGKVVSAKSVKLFPEILACQASYVATPVAGNVLPAVQISLPNGTSVRSDADDVDATLTAFFGRSVTLASAAPKGFTIDHYYPDVPDADPGGHLDTTIEQPLGDALFDAMGVDSPVSVESFFDVFPLSVITTSTLDELRKHNLSSDFDQRRFRMNLVVECAQTGFVENEWVGVAFTVGNNATLAVTMPDPRCVMTTLPQPGLDKDVEILRTMVQQNRIQVGDSGQYPVAGVYAVVTGAGRVEIGDSFAVATG